MNKTTKLFAIALLLVASTSLVNAIDPAPEASVDVPAAGTAAGTAATVGADVDAAAPTVSAQDAPAAAANADADADVAPSRFDRAKSGARRVRKGACNAFDYPLQRTARIGCLKERCQCVRKEGKVKSWISFPVMGAVYTAGIVAVVVIAKKIADKLKNKEAKALDLGAEELA